MHKLNLIQSAGDQFDHRIFKSNSLTEKKIPQEFKARGRILELMKQIELKRNFICYGKRKPEKEIEELIEIFNSLRKIINNELKNELEK